jgi:hypothetical protein
MRHRGGSKLREYATQPELDFLNYVLDGASKTDAARRAGLSKGINITTIMLRPVIDKTFKELQEKRKERYLHFIEIDFLLAGHWRCELYVGEAVSIVHIHGVRSYIDDQYWRTARDANRVKLSRYSVL